MTVAARRDSATPFKVSYQGLQNFQGSNGSATAANGEFIMEYIGGGQWQGKLAGTQFTVPVGHTDNIDLPFVNDPQVIGEWESVDFVADIAEFNPDKPSWTGKLFLPGLTFQENGILRNRVENERRGDASWRQDRQPLRNPGDQGTALPVLRVGEAGLAVKLGVSEGTVKSAVHCLRQRYRQLLRDEIADTVAEPGEVDEELRHLFAVLAGQ